MTRYVAWLMKQTLQKVAERFAIKCEGQCECCPKYIDWRECKAYHSRNICDCVKEFEEWLKEEVEPNHEEEQNKSQWISHGLKPVSLAEQQE